MTLVLETGAGVAGANSYCTVAEVDAYHALFGNTAWPTTPSNEDIAGYQDVNVGGAKTGASTTGLLNDPTVYTATITVDGGTPQSIAVTGSTAQTYTLLLNELNTDTTGATWSLSGGNLRCTSDTTGTSSTISITDTNLFSTLTSYVSVSTAVVGYKGPIYTSKELALINSTNAVDLLYGQRYKSIPQYITQPLLWPRFTMIVNKMILINAGEIPRQIKEAVYETALMYIQGTNVYPSPNTGRQVASKSVTVGEISTSISYIGTPDVETYTGFNKIDLILAPFLINPKGEGQQFRISL